MNNQEFTLEHDNEYEYATSIADIMFKLLRGVLKEDEHRKYVDILEEATMKQRLIYGTYTYQQGHQDSLTDIHRQVMEGNIDNYY